MKKEFSDVVDKVKELIDRKNEYAMRIKIAREVLQVTKHRDNLGSVIASIEDILGSDELI